MLIYFESILEMMFEKMKLWYNLFNFTVVNKKICEQNNEVECIIRPEIDIMLEKDNTFDLCR